MFKKGQEAELYIEDISDQGQGIGKIDGFAVFVQGAVPGDRVKCVLTKVKKNFAFAKLVDILEASSYRVKPSCPNYYECGGCDFGEINYEGQLKIKEKQVKDKLFRIGGIDPEKVKKIMPMENNFHYRNKVAMQISTGGKTVRKSGITENYEKPSVGFFKRKTHDVVDCGECILQNPSAIAAAKAMRRFLEDNNITAWDENRQQGLMKQMTVKTAITTGEVMVVIKINGNKIPDCEKLVHLMDEYINAVNYSLESVYIDNNKDLVNIAGKRVIIEDFGNIRYEISPMSFYQVNPVMTVKMYDKVREYADMKGNETLLDLYCGVGSIGLWCAGDAKNILGIEAEHSAILDANRNAVINRIVHARYIRGKAEKVIKELVCEQKNDHIAANKYDSDIIKMAKKANTVIVDPPRSGCHKDLLDTIVKVAPEKIVYVSCDPAALARDIKILTNNGYEFVEGTPFDVFCHTRHVETVALLFKLDVDKHIDVEIELDLTSAESKATYAQIK